MSDTADPAKPLVLVADDERDIVDLISIVLSRAGYEVVSADEGRAALALARGRRPAVCVLDGLISGLAGFELLRELRDDPQTRSIKVVILTATVDEEREILRHGIEPDGFMAKPFEARELLSEVARLVG